MATSKTKSPSKIAVIGGGSWATAVTKMLCENHVQINWWLRSQTDIEHILKYKHNPSYLSSVPIDTEKVTPTSDIREAVKDVEMIVLAVPAAFIASALRPLSAEDFENKTVISTIKGMIPNENVLVTEYVGKKYKVPSDRLAAIAGPCHAEEVALEKQSYLTICCKTNTYAKQFAQLLNSRYIKATLLADLEGAEYCAVMKNVIAVACGISHGLNNGDNFQAVLVSNALEEIKRFVDKVCPMERNLYASAYVGDLLVTTYSQFSRNRTLGSMVGRGYSVRTAQIEMRMIAEGYYGVKCIWELNKKYKVDMPITNAVYNILYEKISPIVEFQILKDKMK
ncbi:MAG: NAD(P)H-dependent glycerol-3-phosphate dehydrogenase [Bacteroidetes bacterium]|nr:MAG: NAD(P)H-dependent glycerol-3-phosphate dehydrogenase [Bacteroidota bacterium]